MFLSVVRSLCLNRLERAEDAIYDADRALEQNKQSTRALVARGEALYTCGRFEAALLQFERAWKLRQDAAIKVTRVSHLKCENKLVFIHIS